MAGVGASKSPTESCLDNLHQSAYAFRVACPGVANEQLVLFVDGLQHAIRQHPVLIADNRLLQMVQSIMRAQQRGDDVLIADLLEYEVAPLLNRFADRTE